MKDVKVASSNGAITIISKHQDPPSADDFARPKHGKCAVTSGDNVQKEQAKAANMQRQAEIKCDTEKMVELTTELKDYLQ